MGLITSEESCNKGGRRIKVGVTRQDLKDIPVMMVGMEALNGNMKGVRNDHFGSHQIMTRGLCLSEHNIIVTKANKDENVGGCVGVTAILCLSGLPADLTASILAHGTLITSTIWIFSDQRLLCRSFMVHSLHNLHRKHRGNARLY